MLCLSRRLVSMAFIQLVNHKGCMKILIFGHSDSCIHMLTDRFKYAHINIFYKVLIHKNYTCIYMKHQYTYIYFQSIRVTGHRSDKGRA